MILGVNGSDKLLWLNVLAKCEDQPWVISQRSVPSTDHHHLPQGKRTLFQQFKSTHGVSCFYGSLFVCLSLSALGAGSRHGSTTRLQQWSDCPVLKEDLSNYKQKRGSQSQRRSCLSTSCQGQTVCCLDTVHWGLVPGFGNIQKVSWIITLLLQPHREIFHSSFLSEIFFFFFFFKYPFYSFLEF